MFQGADVRGGLVRLTGAWQAMSAHHDYPLPVQRLLGEMVAAAALLASNIKFNGALILQVHGDGPVKLLVVECQSDLSLRATAKLRDEPVPSDASLRELINREGRGRCAITLDPKDPAPGQQAYQGIVPLVGDSVAELIESYMRQSEQLAAKVALAADAHACAGMLLQRLPDHGGSGNRDADAWDRAVTLGRTVLPDELLNLPPEDVLKRLYGQETLGHYAPITPRFACSCSRERIGRMLVSLGQVEVNSIITEQGQVEVTCDFCNRRYHFDPIDAAQLFASGATFQVDGSRPH
jgi:molecular chaperone Hsp33